MSNFGQTTSTSSNNTASSQSEASFLPRIATQSSMAAKGIIESTSGSQGSETFHAERPMNSSLSHKDSFGQQWNSSLMISSNSVSFPNAFDGSNRQEEVHETSGTPRKDGTAIQEKHMPHSDSRSPLHRGLTESPSSPFISKQSTASTFAPRERQNKRSALNDGNARETSDTNVEKNNHRSQSLDTPKRGLTKDEASSQLMTGISAPLPPVKDFPSASAPTGLTAAPSVRPNGIPSNSKSVRLYNHRSIPQLPNAPNVGVAPPPAMYWSKAPIHGNIPKRSFRAHTATLSDEIVWLFGGCDSKGCFKELWCFDTETMSWSKPRVTGDLPPPRRAHSATMVDKRLFVFAGGDGPYYFNDLYMFDTVSLRWTKPDVYGNPPSPRRAHTSNCYDGQLIIFGGGNGIGALNDVYSLDISDPNRLEWKKIECKGKVPIGRGYHTSNIVDGKLIVIGGSDGHMSFNDIHILRMDTQVWYEVKTDEIHHRLGHTATQVGSYLFIIGGHDSQAYTPEILTLNLVNLQWEPRRVCGQKPVGRGYHQAWIRDSRLFIHGGFNGKEVYDDLYYVDLAACAYLPQITSFSVELDDE